MSGELAQLAAVRAARARLDERELDLIDQARHAGETWAQIAGALGLGSRQAAEQRRQRLAAARSARRRELDPDDPRIPALRTAVSDLLRWIAADRRWPTRFHRADLARRTAEAALDAPPGSLYALASHLAADLTRAGRGRLPIPVHRVAARLDTALSGVAAATSGSGTDRGQPAPSPHRRDRPPVGPVSPR